MSERALFNIPMGLLFLEERESYIMLYKSIYQKKKKEMGGKNRIGVYIISSSV